MATQNAPIVATGTAAPVVLPLTGSGADLTRRFLQIKNYWYVPGSTTLQTAILYVAFGVAATAGNNGELELRPGDEYVYGGALLPSQSYETVTGINPNCPTEFISVIASGGTANGMVMTQ